MKKRYKTISVVLLISNQYKIILIYKVCTISREVFTTLFSFELFLESEELDLRHEETEQTFVQQKRPYRGRNLGQELVSFLAWPTDEPYWKPVMYQV